MFNGIVSKICKELPDDWRIVHITIIYKKGHKDVCGISVTRFISRVYTKILKQNVKNYYTNLETKKKRDSFKVGRSSTDYIFRHPSH